MRLFLFHIVLFSSLICLGQKPMVLLDVDPKDAKPGEILTITVKSNVQGEIDIEMPAGFVHGYNVMNGMEQEMDYATGKVITYYYMSQTGAMSKEGSYTFGPAYIKKGSKVYRSNTVSVTIRKEVQQNVSSDDISSKQLRQPAFGVIECSRNSVYEGEPVVLTAKVYSHFNPSHLEDYQSYTMDGVVEKHEIGNSQRILVEETKVKGVRLYSFSYDKNVMFPTGTGKIGIDPFKLVLRKGFEGVPVTSAAAVVEVKPLPKAPIDFAGGVGEFSITRSISGTKFKQGEVLTMTLTVSGKGNLHNLLEPVLQLPKGFIVYGDPVIKENINFTSRGAEGSVSYEYHIQITRHGYLELPGTSFSYFDPEKEKYVRVQTDGQELSVEKDKNFKPDASVEAGETVTIKTPEVGPMRMESDNRKVLDPFGNKGFLIGLGTPLVLAFVFGFYFRRRSSLNKSNEDSVSLAEARKEVLLLLKDARQAMEHGEKEKAGLLLERSLTLHLNQLCKTSHPQLSGSALINACSEKYPELSEQSRRILECCQLARYGMDQGMINAQLIEEVQKLINTNA